MATHLYMCDEGGPMVLGVDGTPPKWATCPVCTKALECAKCEGAQLQGETEPFADGTAIEYRCAAGHVRVIHLPAGRDLPESTHCPDCDGMLLPVSRPLSALSS
jgi:hypothetical protein